MIRLSLPSKGYMDDGVGESALVLEAFYLLSLEFSQLFPFSQLLLSNRQHRIHLKTTSPPPPKPSFLQPDTHILTSREPASNSPQKHGLPTPYPFPSPLENCHSTSASAVHALLSSLKSFAGDAICRITITEAGRCI